MFVLIAFLLAFLNPQLARAQASVSINCYTNNSPVVFAPCNALSQSSTISANNTTAIVVKAAAGVVYQVEAYANNTTLAYVKLYDEAAGTCGTGTPKARYLIPFGASSAGGGLIAPTPWGVAYNNGIVLCITTGIADNDTGAPAANAYIVNIQYK